MWQFFVSLIQDQLHDLLGPGQDKNVGSLVQILRISGWLEQGFQPSAGRFHEQGPVWPCGSHCHEAGPAKRAPVSGSCEGTHSTHCEQRKPPSIIPTSHSGLLKVDAFFSKLWTWESLLWLLRSPVWKMGSLTTETMPFLLDSSPNFHLFSSRQAWLLCSLGLFLHSSQVIILFLYTALRALVNLLKNPERELKSTTGS